MANSIGSITTNIIKDGLVYNIDAANRASTIPKSNVTVIKDTVNNITGSVNNEYDIWEGPTTASFSLDGNDDYIDFESFSEIAGLYALTVSVWFKSSTFTNLGAGNARLIDCKQITIKQSSALYSNTQGRFIYSFLSNPSSIPLFTLGGGSQFGSIQACDGNWHNLCCTYNANTAKAIVYEDGIDGLNQSNDVTAPGGSTLQLDQTIEDLVIGAQASNKNNEIVGNVGPIHIYNRALSANEILHNYNALKGRFGL